MNKYFIVGILLLAATQSTIGFANQHCQNENDVRDDKICKLGKSYREEIENTLKNDIGNSERRVALSRYHSGTENSRIYKERNSNKERSGNEARTFAAFFERSATRIGREARGNWEYTRQIRNDQRLLLGRARESEIRRTAEIRQNPQRVQYRSALPQDMRDRREYNRQERDTQHRLVPPYDTQTRREYNRQDARFQREQSRDIQGYRQARDARSQREETRDMRDRREYNRQARDSQHRLVRAHDTQKRREFNRQDARIQREQSRDIQGYTQARDARSQREETRDMRERREYDRQARDSQHRLVQRYDVQTRRENNRQDVLFQREQSRDIREYRQARDARSQRDMQESREYNRQSRDAQLRREYNNRERRDERISGINRMEARERRSSPTERTVRVEARMRDNRARTTEQRRTDVRRENIQPEIESNRSNKGTRLADFGQRRVIRENRRSMEREYSNARNERSTDAIERFSRISARVSNEKPFAARRDARESRVRVENERLVAERTARDSGRVATKRDQNNPIKYEQWSYFTGFDVAKAICVAMLLTQMAAYGRDEKSKLSFGNMVPQMPSFVGWMKQKVN